MTTVHRATSLKTILKLFTDVHNAWSDCHLGAGDQNLYSVMVVVVLIPRGYGNRSHSVKSYKKIVAKSQPKISNW